MSTAVAETEPCGASEKPAFNRLPVNAIPKQYAITIKPTFEDFTFQGTERIYLEVSMS
jgi:hypothetical protein